MLVNVEWSGVASSKRHTQELPQAQAVGTPPGNSPLATNVFEVTDQKHAKVDARRDGRLSAFLLGGIIPLTAAFDPSVKVGFGEELIELSIEGMSGGFGKSLGSDEESLLSLTPLAHRHEKTSVSLPGVPGDTIAHLSSRRRWTGWHKKILQRTAKLIPDRSCDW